MLPCSGYFYPNNRTDIRAQRYSDFVKCAQLNEQKEYKENIKFSRILGSILLPLCIIGKDHCHFLLQTRG